MHAAKCLGTCHVSMTEACTVLLHRKRCCNIHRADEFLSLSTFTFDALGHDGIVAVAENAQCVMGELPL